MHIFFQFGFRKWKGNVTEKPIEDRSDIIKELYSDLRTVKPHEGNSIFFHFLPTDFLTKNFHFLCLTGSVITFGNILYVFLFGWWISLIYILICPVMFFTSCASPYGMDLRKSLLYQ